jgi:hypothetical protein
MSTTGLPTGRLVARRHWLEYDPVALAVLVIGIGSAPARRKLRGSLHLQVFVGAKPPIMGEMSRRL